MSVLQSDLKLLKAARMIRSDAVDAKVIDIVADVGRDKWQEIGRQLGLTDVELRDYEHFRTMKEKMHQVLYDWTRKDETATTGQLLDVCEKVGIGGIVRRLVSKQTATSQRGHRRSTSF